MADSTEIFINPFLYTILVVLVFKKLEDRVIGIQINNVTTKTFKVSKLMVFNPVNLYNPFNLVQNVFGKSIKK